MPRQLNSVLKNVPLELMDQVRQFRTKNSRYNIRWKMREPKEGKKYSWGGSLKRENATSADLYVDFNDRYWEGFEAGRKSQLEKTEVYKNELSRSQLACIERGKENEALEYRIEENEKLKDQVKELKAVIKLMARQL